MRPLTPKQKEEREARYRGRFTFLRGPNLDDSLHGPVTALADMLPVKRAEMLALYANGPTRPIKPAVCECPRTRKNPPYTCMPGCPALDREAWELVPPSRKKKDEG